MSPLIQKIQKRDGRVVDFDQSKITEAIWKSVQAIGGEDKKMAQQIANQVTAVLEVFFKDPEKIPTGTRLLAHPKDQIILQAAVNSQVKFMATGNRKSLHPLQTGTKKRQKHTTRDSQRSNNKAAI